jgi:putative ABC transport system substrate-binding protein
MAIIGRRKFIAALGGGAAWPLGARAQQSAKKIPVVGVLWHAGSAEQEDVYLSVLRKAFSDLGYIEGKNIQLEHRFPAEQPDRFRTLARELIESRADAIIAVTTLGAVELKKLTSSIPIVFVLVADPVGFGLIESLGRPGGNATGLSLMTNDLSGKRLELLKEAVPRLSRVALLVDRTDAFKERTIKANQAAAEALGISLRSAEIRSADDIEPVFAKIAQEGADGVAWGGGGLLFIERARMGAAALTHRLPALVTVAEEVPYGLLMSYGQDLPDFFRRAAGYVDKILKGARPVDLPVEQPTKLKLVLNLKTAKALGLTVPNTLLVSADELIE